MCRRILLLLGCLTVTASADLLVDRLPADKADLVSGEDSQVKSEEQRPDDTSSSQTQQVRHRGFNFNSSLHSLLVLFSHFNGFSSVMS